MTYNWLLTELIAEEKMAALRNIDPHVAEAHRLDAKTRTGLRAGIASTLVRVGMSLDAAAGRRAAAIGR